MSTSEPEAEALPPGTVIAGKYEVGEVLGAGGMGRVYRAMQTSLGTEVCIKTLHSGATADPQFAARFEREAKSTSQLRHPHIVSVFDYGQHVDGSSYLVMELVSGLPLSKVARKKPMPQERAVDILSQVCDGLEFAHERGVIHRDLKPPNIMISEVGGRDFVKILDFGSAFTVEDGEAERLTRQGMVLGTPAYMAPEYILGRGTDARVDVYAVGILLYVLLTGGPPFRGATQAVFAQQVSVSPERPRLRNPTAGISPAIEAVVMKALVKDPARRYASAAELKQAMQEALAAGHAEVEYEADTSGAIGVEVARDERPVIVLTIETDGEVDGELTQAVATAARGAGGVVSGDEDKLRVIFALDREVPEAAAEAMRFASRFQLQGRRLRFGIRDAQASVKGRFGVAGFEYEVFGKGADTADLLATHAPDHRVLICGPVARHVPLDLRLAPVPAPTGVHEPVFDLEDPLGTSVENQLPFVGRAAEQRRLLELAVGASEGRVLVLTGGEGMGKSRLLRDIVPQASHLDVLWSVVPAHGEMGPAHPTSALSALGWSSGGTSTGSTTERFVVALMVGEETGAHEALSGERRQLRLVSAAMDGVIRRAAHGPVVVVLDQLHLADETALTLASRLAEMAPELGISLVLATRRLEDLPFDLPKHAETLQLGPLGRDATLALCKSTLPDLPDESLAELVDASHGIPLLLEELLRLASEEGARVLSRLAGRGPEDVAAQLFRRRLSQLSEPARSLLEAAAVLGGRPRQQEAEELSKLGAGAAEALAELGRAALVSRTALGRLELRLPGLGRRVRELLDLEQKRLLHHRASQMLESLGPARMAEVGEHRLEAGDLVGAFEALSTAGRAAWADGETAKASRCLTRALLAGSRLGDGLPAERAKLARDLGRLEQERGELGRAEKVLRDAFPLARAASDGELAADLLRRHGKVLTLQGDFQDGHGEVQAAYRFAADRELPNLAAAALCDLAEIGQKRGDKALAREALDRGVAMLEGRETPEASAVRIRLYNRLGRLELEEGNMAGAIAVFTQALSLAERMEDRYQEAGLLGNLGGAYARRGAMDRALHFTERAQRASDALGDQIGYARQSFNLAILHLGLKHKERAEGLLRTSYHAARSAGWREGLAMSTAALSKLGAHA
ncbi:MAG: protein kinase [Deltaproteobacteria bacterium]|nr:protein kinase [Deltaproteobacteria bacterium]